MAEVFDEYAEDREAAPPQNILQELESMARLFVLQEREVSLQEEKLKEVTAKRNKTRFKDFPELMKRAGNLLEHKLQLPDGMEAVITRSKDTGGALSKGNKEHVLSYMIEKGYAHLISNDIVSSFTAGQKEEYDAAIAKMKEAGLQYSVDKTVQSSRYSAWCARMVEDSKIVDDEFGLFGIHVVEQVKMKIKEPKTRKGRGTE